MLIRQLYIGKTDARRYRGCIKIGIAEDTDKRWKDIDRSVSGSREWPVFTGMVLFAKWHEKRLHRKYRKYRVRFKGSGKTEWFRLPVALRWKVIVSVMMLTAVTWAGITTVVFLIFLAILRQ